MAEDTHTPPVSSGPGLSSRIGISAGREPCAALGVDARELGLVLVEKSRVVSISPLCTLTGAFLIPYVVFFICCGIPVFFLETALGQFTSEGGITCWRRVCPLFEGKRRFLQQSQVCLTDAKLPGAAKAVSRDRTPAALFCRSAQALATQRR